MKLPDVDRLRSERTLSLPGFLETYNAGLPEGFPPATAELLKEFKKTHVLYFKTSNDWSLDQHRKPVMDWLPGQYRREEQAAALLA